jgi:hypothetical protein
MQLPFDHLQSPVIQEGRKSLPVLVFYGQQ